MKLEEAKKLQNMFKLNLNEISRGRYKSKEQKQALENINLIYGLQEVVIKLVNDYSSIVSEAKYKNIHGKGFPSMLACVIGGRVARNANISDHSNLKILNPKQMLQRLPIGLAQFKACDTSESLLNEIREIIYYLY